LALRNEQYALSLCLLLTVKHEKVNFLILLNLSNQFKSYLCKQVLGSFVTHTRVEENWNVNLRYSPFDVPEQVIAFLSVQHPAHDLPLERLLAQRSLRRRSQEVDGHASQLVLEAVLNRQDLLDGDDGVIKLHVLVTAHLACFLESGFVQLIQFGLFILE